MYTQTVMEHFLRPQNVGEIESADGVGEVGNAACGDIMRITLKVQNGRIEDIRFKTFGCAAAIATSSMITELAKGKSLNEAKRITNKDVAEALEGLPPIKMHCSNLAASALRAAISDYEQKHGINSEPDAAGGGEGGAGDDCRCESPQRCGM